jgi:hypothetical protein
VQHHALRIDVADLEMAQFVGTQGSGIEGGEDGPVFQVVGVIEDAGDLFGAQDGDGLWPFLGGGNLFVEPPLLEYPGIEKLQGSPIHLERAPLVLFVIA